MKRKGAQLVAGALAMCVVVGAIYVTAGLALQRAGVLELGLAQASQLRADYSKDPQDARSLQPLSAAIIADAAKDTRRDEANSPSGAMRTPTTDAAPDVEYEESPDDAKPKNDQATQAPRPTRTVRATEAPSTKTPSPTDTPAPCLLIVLCGPAPTDTPDPCDERPSGQNCRPTPTNTPKPEPTSTPTLTLTPTATRTPKCRLPGDNSGPGSGNSGSGNNVCTVTPTPTRTPSATPTPKCLLQLPLPGLPGLLCTPTRTPQPN